MTLAAWAKRVRARTPLAEWAHKVTCYAIAVEIDPMPVPTMRLTAEEARDLAAALEAADAAMMLARDALTAVRRCGIRHPLDCARERYGISMACDCGQPQTSNDTAAALDKLRAIDGARGE